MFLDEELLLICMCTEADTPEKIQQLNVDICTKCEEYYKSKLSPIATQSEIKTLLDRTFNLFDSFVRMAKKDDDVKLQLLGKMFEKHTYKTQFLKNPAMLKIYNDLN